MIVRRKAIVRRRTLEVDIVVEVDLDGGKVFVSTGIPFFDHMLVTLGRYASMELRVEARGDLEHHTIEDVAIALGQAIKRALGDKRGIKRIGHSVVPMDDALAICAVDLSGRGVFVFEGNVGDCEMRTQDFLHFFDTLCRNSGANTHLIVRGTNGHHMIEASFKAFGIAFMDAKRLDEGTGSTKGVLD